MNNSRSVLDMSNKEARKFFLKNESYFNLKLPSYFDFEPLLNKIYQDNSRKTNLSNYFDGKSNSPKFLSDVNYNFNIYKSDRLSFRKLCLTNPIIYVSLVQDMCTKEHWDLIIKRFKKFQSNKKIVCCSIPVESIIDYDKDIKEQVLTWWDRFEQETIVQSSYYPFMIITDITNCYPSVYTHTISWALHDEIYAKEHKDDKTLYGNRLDTTIQSMSYGQTNGLSQGSVLYDFIAEMILGYADMLLTARLKELKYNDYKILRYRDDYRIFGSREVCKNIFKELSNILNHLNFKLNPNKTIQTDDIIGNSLKKDKIYGLLNPLEKSNNIQKKLFVIRDISIKYPSSGLLVKLLLDYYKNDILPLKEKPLFINQILAIIYDIMLKNSRVIPECISILSKLFSFMTYNERNKYLSLFNKKNIDNIDYLYIWLQRLTVKTEKNTKYNSLLCKKIHSNKDFLWNCRWSTYLIDESLIVNRELIKEMDKVVSTEEIDSFVTNFPYN